MDEINKRPVNLLYIDPSLKLGGANISLIELMEALDPHRYHPIVLCPGKGPFSELCQQKGIQVEYLAGLPPFGGKPLDFVRVLLPNTIAISKLIQQLDIQLVHSNTWRVAYYCGLAAHKQHIPAVTHVRDYNESYRSWLKYWSFGMVSDAIITESHAIRESIRSRIPKLDRKITTIHFGLPTPSHYEFDEIKALRSEFGMVDTSPLLAVVGSFSALKGQAIILKAMPQILSKFPQTKLLLVGEPLSKAQEPYHEELLRIVHQYGMEEHVVFTGFRTDVPLIMAGLDVLVHPPTMPDAFPHVLLEGGAQKALIVASKIGGIGEIIEDGVSGRLVPPGQPESLAQAIIDLLDHPKDAERMREAIFKRVMEEFTISRHVSEVQTLYKELLKSMM